MMLRSLRRRSPAARSRTGFSRATSSASTAPPGGPRGSAPKAMRTPCSRRRPRQEKQHNVKTRLDSCAFKESFSSCFGCNEPRYSSGCAVISSAQSMVVRCFYRRVTPPSPPCARLFLFCSFLRAPVCGFPAGHPCAGGRDEPQPAGASRVLHAVLHVRFAGLAALPALPRVHWEREARPRGPRRRL